MSDKGRFLPVFTVALACALCVSRIACADAAVPVVAVFDYPFAIVSVFWIAPLEAGIVRLRERDSEFGALLWDFWLANWVSLLAGMAALAAVFGVLASLDAIGVFAHFRRVADIAEYIRPFELEGSKRPFSTVFFVSLGWFALTLPVTILVEGRFLRRRWEKRGEITWHSPMAHSAVVNCISYATLLGLLSALFLRR